MNAEAARGGSGAMFDAIAGRYDLLNRILSLGMDRGWRAETVAAIAGAGRVLDVATGTGDVAMAIARRYPSAEVLGVDPSEKMLEVARTKLAQFGDRVDVVVGDAQALPFDDGGFDAVTIAFGIRNVPDRARALREMARVIRPGGTLAVLELTEPQRGWIAPFARFHVHHVVPWLGALLSGAREYRYLASSIAAFPDSETFARMIEDAGCTNVHARPFTFGTCTLFTATRSAS